MQKAYLLLEIKFAVEKQQVVCINQRSWSPWWSLDTCSPGSRIGRTRTCLLQEVLYRAIHTAPYSFQLYLLIRVYQFQHIDFMMPLACSSALMLQVVEDIGRKRYSVNRVLFSRYILVSPSWPLFCVAQRHWAILCPSPQDLVYSSHPISSVGWCLLSYNAIKEIFPQSSWLHF